MKLIFILSLLVTSCVPAYIYTDHEYIENQKAHPVKHEERDPHGCLKGACYWDSWHGQGHCTCKGDRDYGLL